jgi:hypothetical protein
MSKLNPLHTPEMIAQVISTTGEYFDPKRGSGRSTALALHYISDAIELPRAPIRIKDHYDSAQADRHLAETVKMMIFKLELKHMYVWGQHHGGDRVKFYVSFGESLNR